MAQKFVTFQWLGSQGQLGNQLYEIATSFAYAKRFNYKLLINWTYYSHYLNHSQLSVPPHSGKVFQYLEPTFRYTPIPPIPDGFQGIDLRGYFQSSKYYNDCIDDIRKIFLLKNEHMKTIMEWVNANQVDLSKSVSLHVRRGDFINNNNVSPIPVSWYVAALNLIPESIDTVLFFSDDIEWCKLNFKNLSIRPFEFKFVEGLANILDMFLMSLCNGHIISNSSFSQWGSWLNPNPNKLIIGPALDQLYTNVDMIDVIEPNWVLLDKYGQRVQ